MTDFFGALSPPLNIFSGEPGLGGQLTNPTELAKQKGCIHQSFPVVFLGKRWPDVETAYQVLKKDSPPANDVLLVELIAAKFRQHPSLAEAVAKKGGAAWLRTCSHLTRARTPGAQSWEGIGEASRFIRVLALGYEAALASQRVEEGQAQLF